MKMPLWEKNIPMMSLTKLDTYLNIIFQKGDDGKYSLGPDTVKIEGPLPTFEKIFKNYQHCDLISTKQYEQEGELINDFLALKNN